MDLQIVCVANQFVSGKRRMREVVRTRPGYSAPPPHKKRTSGLMRVSKGEVKRLTGLSESLQALLRVEVMGWYLRGIETPGNPGPGLTRNVWILTFSLVGLYCASTY